MPETARSPIWSASEVTAATGGRPKGPDRWSASGVCIDSRELAAGDLFIALIGENRDGHAFVRQALDNGAAAALVAFVPEDVGEDEPLIIVDDTYSALKDLGRAARQRCAAHVIAVTGSVGKTGTREMLAAAFGAQGLAHSSVKSHNNELGVALSLARTPPGADYAIFELGMNHPREIAPLSQMVKPDIAIVLNVREAHIENFADGITGIARAKAEIFEGLQPGGTAIIGHDNAPECTAILTSAAQTYGAGAIRYFSDAGKADADAWLGEVLEAANGTRVTARLDDRHYIYGLQALGRHYAINSLAVLLALDAAGCDIDKGIKALGELPAPKGRGRREEFNIGEPDNPVTLIDESYNASPASMKAAFKVLALVDPGRGGRRIAVLGDMRELGDDAPKLHADLALPLKAANVDLVYTCGTLMRNLHDQLPDEQRGAHTEEPGELAEIVPDVLVPGDVVMVKGSRGAPPPGLSSQMEIVVEALRALPVQKGQSQAGQPGDTNTNAL